MGGSRLHHFFVSGDDDVRISEVLSSTYIGVDASWMMQKYLQEYKSAIRADDCTRAVCEFVQRLEYIEKEDVFVHVVFDGECPPCKRDEARRREQAGGLRRTRALEKGIMAALRARETDYVVAPYEAETQLVYMQKSGRIQHILASDADYFALGCRKMLWDFRLQSNMCWGQVIDVDDAMLSAPDNRSEQDVAFLSVFQEKGDVVLRMYAALAGCDYVDFRGIGPARARAAIVEVGKRKVLCVEQVAHVAYKHVEGDIPFAEFLRKLKYAMLCFTKPVVYDVHRGIRVTLDGRALDSHEEAVVGTCHKEFDVASFARGDIDPRTGADDVVTPHAPDDENFFSVVDGRVEYRDLPDSNFTTVAGFMRVTRSAQSRKNYMMQNDLFHGDPSRPGVHIEKNVVPDCKNIAAIQEKLTRFHVQGCRRPLRDMNGRSEAEIIAQSRGRGPATSSSTEEQLKPPAWFDANADWYINFKNSLPLMSMEVVERYFKKFPGSQNANVIEPLIRGMDLVRTSTNYDTMRYAYRYENEEKGEARCWWRTTWRSNFKTSDVWTTDVTLWRENESMMPRASSRVVAVDRAVCSCVSGVTGWCKHIAAALIVFHQLNQKNVAADELTCTSKPCTWAAPPKNAMKKSKEVRHVEFRQVKANRARSPASRACRNVDGARDMWQVYDDDTLAEMDAFDDERLEQELFAEFRKASDGEPCATERYRRTLATARTKRRPQNSLHFILHDSRLS